MHEAPPEQVLYGTKAAPGLAAGPLHVFTTESTTREPGTPQQEQQALQDAVARAKADIDGLIAGQDRLAADILEFQTALLDDDDLLEPVAARIADGEAADVAWQAHLDVEIEDYASGDDEYLAARATDLADLRDRVVMAMTGSVATGLPPNGCILAAADLTPSRFIELAGHLAGLALSGGSPTNHTAILARARGLPMLTGISGLAGQDECGAALLDADQGTLTLCPDDAAREAFEARLRDQSGLDSLAAEAARQPAITRTGRRITTFVNIDTPAILDGLDPECCDGVGLTRTEFLLDHGLPDEDTQTAAYTRIIEWAAGRPVTIRTIDAGGDKPVPGLTIDDETNPFLGVRGVRLSLLRPEVFSIQLRAIARAAARSINGAPVKLMLPMVTVPTELEAARDQLDEALASLTVENVEHARPALGIMIETPAAALTVGDFDADFLSIGSNDLIQYTTATARDNPGTSSLADPTSPAVLELIRRTVEAGREKGIEVSLCGDMASEPALIATLLGLGVDCLSSAPATLGRVKLAIAASD